MLSGIANWRNYRTLLGLVAIVSLTGCVHLPRPATDTQINALRLSVVSLSPDIQEEEAARLAVVAYNFPRHLAGEYRLVRPPILHNLLINVGVKKRGLCYHWAEDLVAELQSLQFNSIELRWGAAARGTIGEHNAVVVTGRGQPFAKGLVLDPWRHSGELFWTPVAADSYAWQEGELYPQPSPAPVTAQTATR